MTSIPPPFRIVPEGEHQPRTDNDPSALSPADVLQASALIAESSTIIERSAYRLAGNADQTTVALLILAADRLSALSAQLGAQDSLAR